MTEIPDGLEKDEIFIQLFYIILAKYGPFYFEEKDLNTDYSTRTIRIGEELGQLIVGFVD